MSEPIKIIRFSGIGMKSRFKLLLSCLRCLFTGELEIGYTVKQKEEGGHKNVSSVYSEKALYFSVATLFLLLWVYGGYGMWRSSPQMVLVAFHALAGLVIGSGLVFLYRLFFMYRLVRVDGGSYHGTASGAVGLAAFICYMERYPSKVTHRGKLVASIEHDEEMLESVIRINADPSVLDEVCKEAEALRKGIRSRIVVNTL